MKTDKKKLNLSDQLSKTTGNQITRRIINALPTPVSDKLGKSRNIRKQEMPPMTKESFYSALKVVSRVTR